MENNEITKVWRRAAELELPSLYPEKHLPTSPERHSRLFG
jgi:hypothetical protein